MAADRRGAARHRVPEGVTAEVSGVDVRLIDLSLLGGKVEHQDRFTLTAPQLTMTWRGTTMTAAVRGARSEIVGRHGGRLVYNTALFFVSPDPVVQGFIGSMLREPESTPLDSAPVPETPPSTSEKVTEAKSADDSWTRRVYLLRRHELDDDLPYAQFRLMPTGWQKEYVASPAQPDDGFTIPRERHDFHELQRAFESVDLETRRMMQIALESQLQKPT